MDKDSFIKALTDIGTCEDDVTRRTMLSEFQQEYTVLFDDIEKLTKDNENLVADNEAVRQANMKLFLSMGEKSEPQTKPETTTREKIEKSFTDLYYGK